MFPTVPHSLQRIVRFVRKERRPQNRRHAQQPRFLVLEERALLSTLTVTSSADSATQNHTLRYAVDHAHSGDTIQLTAAIKNPIVMSLGELVVNQNVTIKSVPSRTPTISGGGISRVFEISAGANVTLDNLKIIDGNGVADNPSGSAGYDGNAGAILNLGTLTVSDSTLSGNTAAINMPGGGGGVFSAGGTTTLTNCTISGNSAVRDGGGVFADGGTMTLTNCTVSDNSAGVSGGGVLAYTGSTMTLTNCTVSGNSANLGGGIFNEGTLTVSGSTFANNHASFYGGGLVNKGHMDVLDCGFTGNSAGSTGGGISNSAGTGTVSGCGFTRNSAGAGGGGGISVFAGQLSLFNDTFADNSTTGSGGGVGVVSGSATVIGCTFTNNTAAVQGGGIANVFGTLSVGTSTFSGNTPDDIFGVYTDLGGNTFL